MLKVFYTCLISCLLWSLPLQAKEYGVKDIAMVHLQDKTRFVCNPDGILSENAVNTMDSILYALEQRTGIETVVVAIKEMNGSDCFEFAYQLGQQNGVGKKKTNNGLVIFLCTEERCIQFATGYGIEGTLPDAICKRIQVQKMNPYFKDNQWDEGMVAGVRAIFGYLDGSMEFEPEDDELDGEIGFGILSVCIIGFILIFFIVYWIEREKSKCPKCKKHTLKRCASRTLSNRGGVKKEEVTYLCTNCGHKLTRIETSETDDGFNRGGGAGPIFGSGRGFSGGGGGFGGSFGGGSFGGGGAGSRF